jgi:hypothetical protein
LGHRRAVIVDQLQEAQQDLRRRWRASRFMAWRIGSGRLCMATDAVLISAVSTARVSEGNRWHARRRSAIREVDVWFARTACGPACFDAFLQLARDELEERAHKDVHAPMTSSTDIIEGMRAPRWCTSLADLLEDARRVVKGSIASRSSVR